MGFLDRFFKKKSEDKEQAIQIPEDWNSYLCSIDGKVGSYFLNLALINIVPIVEKNALLWVEFVLNDPSDDGLITDQEYIALMLLEDKFIPQIENELDALYVGRLIHDGKCEFYFYFKESKYEQQIIQQIVDQLVNYKISFGLKDDPNWSAYRESIYPNVYAMQSIRNIQVIMNLEKHGDSLVIERPVEHWCYFKTSEGREKFIATISVKGFEINGQSYHDESENPYCVQLVRMDRVELNNINDVTWMLLELCIENGGEYDGEYDGWETPVIRH